MQSTTSRGVTWFLTIAAVLGFFAATSIRLDVQGMYYDEMHQAPAAFFYIGANPAMFTILLRGVPVMNMTYSGAIKSTLYGLYLRFGRQSFTVYSWRMMGIVLAAAGLLVFYRTAGSWLPLAGAILFEALLVTDTSAILMTRHDWGPVALALGLRLAFLGIWTGMTRTPTRWGCGLAGAIIGIALFEKLSSVVLLVPFALFLWMIWNSFRPGFAAAIYGFLLGSVPLILVNIASWKRGEGLLSLSNVTRVRPLELGGAFGYARDYLTLGQGIDAQEVILGSHTSFAPTAEWCLMLALMLLIVAVALRDRSNRWLRLAALCAISYAGIGIGLFLLPQETGIHHWILGTPFQYLAIVLAFAGSTTASPERNSILRARKASILAGATVLLVVRAPNIVGVERALLSGESSDLFSPELTQLAELAAAKSESAVFVSADWGTGTQLYCGMNGKRDSVYEPFGNENPARAVLDIAKTTTKPNLYVIIRGAAPQFASASESILHAMSGAPGWQEAPAEMEFSHLTLIRVRKFVRTDRRPD